MTSPDEPELLLSDYRYEPTPDGPLLPRGVGRPRRSSPRARGFEYTGPYAYSLTINTARGQPAFAEKSFARFSVGELLKLAKQHDFEVLAYCFMPNHTHLLTKGTSTTSELKPFVQRFKQSLGFAFRTEHGRQLWQRSFWDHTARVDEDLHRAAAYIWANPVRARIVDRMEEYPWSGPRERMDADAAGPRSARGLGAPRHVGGQSLSSVPTSNPTVAPEDKG